MPALRSYSIDSSGEDMHEIITDIRSELRQMADEKVRQSGERFFKEDVKLYGIRAADVRKTAKNRFREIKNSGKTAIFSLCDELWSSGYLEEASIASEWAYGIRKDFVKDDFRTFEKWVKTRVSNWASCDTLCNHTGGAIVEMYPELTEELVKWARSENLWVRRASAVTLIIPARQGLFLQDVFRIADILLLDNEDMVQKGYGWMLKAASESHRDEVFDFVMNRKDSMPRTSLRYAIEKMPKDMKSAAMSR